MTNPNTKPLDEFARLRITDAKTKKSYQAIAAYNPLFLNVMASTLIDKGIGGVDLADGLIRVVVMEDAPAKPEPQPTKEATP